MRIALFFDRSPGTVGEYFLSAFTSLGHTVDHFSTSFADKCPGGYDLHLRIDHGDYTRDLPSRLRPSAFYVVDTHLTKSWESIQRQAAWYDIVFCVQQQAARRLRRAFWVPLACDPQVHQPVDGPQRYDLAFVGNDGGVPRKFYLQELRERYPRSFIGKAPFHEMGTIYSQATLGFHYIECPSPVKDMVSMRVYEVLAAKRVLLVNALGEGVYESLGMRDRHELVMYRTPKELFEMIDYYLAHASEREQIAATGQACVLNRHTYRHRAQQMIDLVAQEGIVPATVGADQR